MKWSGVGTAMREVGVPLERRQLGRVAGHDRGRVVVEAPGPVEAGVGLRPVDATEVVHDVAAADDEHAAVAQRRERGAELEVVLEAAWSR